MSRRVEWLPEAGGDFVGMGSSDHANRVVAAIDDFAALGRGILSLGKGPRHNLYVQGAPYRVVVRFNDEVVIVERIVER